MSVKLLAVTVIPAVLIRQTNQRTGRHRKGSTCIQIFHGYIAGKNITDLDLIRISDIIDLLLCGIKAMGEPYLRCGLDLYVTIVHILSSIRFVFWHIFFFDSIPEVFRKHKGAGEIYRRKIQISQNFI